MPVRFSAVESGPRKNAPSTSSWGGAVDSIDCMAPSSPGIAHLHQEEKRATGI